ncbi:MAG TPA: ATP-binding protein [Gaiellaceae bacterium]|jgi:serine/threonine-protein kinase RsbW
MTDVAGTRTPMVELVLDARPENLALARLALAGVAATAGAPREVVSDLKLAVTEACTNAIQHAYGGGAGAGRIVVRYRVEPGRLSIEVEDSGPGFELGSPAAVGDRNGGGNGLMIMRVLTDELSVTSAGTGTRVAFVKRFSPES